MYIPDYDKQNYSLFRWKLLEEKMDTSCLFYTQSRFNKFPKLLIQWMWEIVCKTLGISMILFLMFPTCKNFQMGEDKIVLKKG